MKEFLQTNGDKKTTCKNNYKLLNIKKFKINKKIYKNNLHLSYTIKVRTGVRKGMLMTVLDNIKIALQEGEAEQVIKGICVALDNGYEAEEILNKGLLAGMNCIAENFRKNIIFIPHVLLAARAMAAGMQVLNSTLSSRFDNSNGAKVVIGTIEGDLHDLGKNLVKALLEREGFKVYDLGRDVAVQEFIKATRELNPQILAISASLTSTMGGIKKVIKVLEKAGLRENVYVMVGGVPITQTFAKEAGADLCPRDANDAAKIAKEIFYSATNVDLSLIS
ncbi:MAG: hypothetical protein PWQ96_1764 [Clostridia bacterium]|nr:hypothetical protein [Clostridia bacterium]